MTDKLETELEALKARIEELERRAKPPEPFKPDPNWRPPINPIDRISMPVSVMRDMVNAVPDAMVREIVNGNRAPGTLAPLADANTRPRVAQGNRSGWRDAQPLTNPPGVAQADRLMDAADARDRADLIAAEARRRLMK
jgi:hypothetical protein